MFWFHIYDVEMHHYLNRAIVKTPDSLSIFLQTQFMQIMHEFTGSQIYIATHIS